MASRRQKIEIGQDDRLALACFGYFGLFLWEFVHWALHDVAWFLNDFFNKLQYIEL